MSFEILSRVILKDDGRSRCRMLIRQWNVVKKQKLWHVKY